MTENVLVELNPVFLWHKLYLTRRGFFY